MPLEMPNLDGGEPSRPTGTRRDWQERGLPERDRPSRHWWRPVSAVGRVFLLLATLIVLGGCAASIYLLKTYLGRDGRFRIASAHNIEASGLTEVSREELMPVFEKDIGRNIFFVPLNERRKQLEEIPWIEKATVMRLLPDQIQVTVVERRPVAFVRQGQQVGLVDANGVLLTMPAAMMAQHNYSFPVVTGLNAQDPLDARKVRMAVYQRLLGELDANGQNFSAQISEIDLTDPQDARVLMPEQGADILAHFGQDHFLDRYQRYKAYIVELRQKYPNLAAVDLRNDQQVVLEMTPGTNVAQAAADEQAAANVGDSKSSQGPAAQSGQTAGESPEKQPSGAKAPINAAGSDTGAKAQAKHSRPAAKGKQGSKGSKAGGKTSVKRKTSLNSGKARTKKQTAKAKRAALNARKRKTTATVHPAAPAGEGQ
jgi:cell division protein FtsQ